MCQFFWATLYIHHLFAKTAANTEATKEKRIYIMCIYGLIENSITQ